MRRATRNLLEELLWGCGEVYRKPKPEVEADLASLGVRLQHERPLHEVGRWYLLDAASLSRAAEAVGAVWHDETQRWVRS